MSFLTNKTQKLTHEIFYVYGRVLLSLWLLFNNSGMIVSHQKIIYLNEAYQIPEQKVL